MFVAVTTSVCATVVLLPIITSLVVRNVTSDAVKIITLVVSPTNAVFKVPVTEVAPTPCVTTTPALAVIVCEAIAIVHAVPEKMPKFERDKDTMNLPASQLTQLCTDPSI